MYCKSASIGEFLEFRAVSHTASWRAELLVIATTAGSVFAERWRLSNGRLRVGRRGSRSHKVCLQEPCVPCRVGLDSSTVDDAHVWKSLTVCFFEIGFYRSLDVAPGKGIQIARAGDFDFGRIVFVQDARANSAGRSRSSRFDLTRRN